MTLAVLPLAAALAVSPGSSTLAAATSPSHVVGADVSWPECPKGMGIPERRSEGQPMPLRSAQFVVIGLTNGPAFSVNPCLAAQVGWVKRRHLYAGAYSVITYPRRHQLDRYGSSGPFRPGTKRWRLRNVGYAQARYNLAHKGSAGLKSPMVWLDVEPYPVAPWSPHPYANRAVIRGALRAYRDAGLRVGIYSFSAWRSITRRWRLPHIPYWATAGQTSAAKAQAKCGRSDTGGPVWIAQWWSTYRDFDLTCQSTTARLHTMFVKF